MLSSSAKAFDGKGNIWALASNMFAEANEADKKTPKTINTLIAGTDTKLSDVSLVFLGNDKSGKTSLINSYLSSIPVSEVKQTPNNNAVLATLAQSSSAPTDATTKATSYNFLDYKYLELNDYNLHLYELSGGRKMSSLLDQILTQDNIQTTLIYIVLDLTKPYYMLEHALFWLAKVKQRVHSIFQAMVAQRIPSLSIIPQKLMKLTASCIPTTHADKALLKPVPVPVCLLPNKYDAFSQSIGAPTLNGGMLPKLLGAHLRYLAHKNGTSVLCVAKNFKNAIKVLHMRTSKFQTNQYYPLHHGTTNANTVTTGAGASGKAAAMPHQPDPLKPLSVLFGSDTYAAIAALGTQGVSGGVGVSALHAGMGSEAQVAEYHRQLKPLLSLDKGGVDTDAELAFAQACAQGALAEGVLGVLGVSAGVAEVLRLGACVGHESAEGLVDNAVVAACVDVTRAKQEAALARKLRQQEREAVLGPTPIASTAPSAAAPNAPVGAASHASGPTSSSSAAAGRPAARPVSSRPQRPGSNTAPGNTHAGVPTRATDNASGGQSAHAASVPSAGPS